MTRWMLVALVMLLSSPDFFPARADHFIIDLQARAVMDAKPIQAIHPQPDQKPQPRAILTSRVDTPITVKWTLGSTDKSATVKNVLVHFYVVKEEKPDQEEVPKLTQNVLVESALKMDFKPQDRSEGEVTFMVSTPGCYLIRLELKGAVGKEEREPFAALDLLIR